MWRKRPWGVYGTTHPVMGSTCVRIYNLHSACLSTKDTAGGEGGGMGENVRVSE